MRRTVDRAGEESTETDQKVATEKRLQSIPNLTVQTGTELSKYTRFAIGGPADIYAETTNAEAFVEALQVSRSSGLPWVVLGAGTNLIVSDNGFRGVVVRYSANAITAEDCQVRVDAGAVLQDLVDFSNARGLKGLETLAGIPGWVGAAIYGNAGAYGHSMSELVLEVRFVDGDEIRTFSNSECQFRYRESVFKAHKEWIILSGILQMQKADAVALQKVSADIVKVRNEKFPPTMRCAGSIFKNFLLAELPSNVAAQVPERVIREGKVPSAYFLEEVGAKGMSLGGIHIADYHANLIYNRDGGTAEELRTLITLLKNRVGERFGIELEEEVQYVGF